MQSAAKSEHGNLLRFAFCASGICLCYWFYGIMQENLLSNSSLGATFILVAQAVANIFVAILWQRIQAGGRSSSSSSVDTTSTTPKTDHGIAATKEESASLNHLLLLLTSAFYVFAMIGSNEALQYVSYPTAVLAKSCKLLPTMVMGVLIERRAYSIQQWVSALAISVGMSLFHLSRIQQQSSSHESDGGSDDGGSSNENDTDNNNDNSTDDESWKGMALLLGSLTCDGFLGSCQGILKRPDSSNNQERRQRPPTAMETMLYINIYALLFLIPMAMITGQLEHGMYLMRHDTQLRNAIFILNTVVSIGQIFIFLTVTWYSSLVCTTITTTRKFFTILLSVLYFGHRFSAMQWCAVALVFSGLYLAAIAKDSKTATGVATKVKTTKTE